MADYAAVKKKLLGLFLGVGVVATFAMYWIERGDWQLALVLFVVGNVGVAGSIVFYESLLPHLVERGGARQRVVGGLCGWIPGRRPAAGHQPAG